MSSHYWYWIHTVESKIDLDSFEERLNNLCCSCPRNRFLDKNCELRILTITNGVNDSGHRSMKAFCSSDYYEAKINIEMEDTGLLHLIVDLSEISIPIYARINWLRSLVELYPHKWYSDDDVHVLTSELETRNEAIDDIGRKFYDVITNSFDLSFIPNNFNQITADAKVFMIFSNSFMEIFPELDENIRCDLNHLQSHLHDLLEVKMKSDEVYWNYRSSILVERLTILTVFLAILSLAVAFLSEYIFREEVEQSLMDLSVVVVIAVSFISLAVLFIHYRPFKNTVPSSNTITKEMMQKKVDIVKSSAQLGDTNAQLELARMYEGGIGVEQSNVEAVLWYTRAANNGNAEAQFNLGVICEGDGTKESYKKAAEWYMKAISQGHVKAHNYYGELCKMGWGVEQSYSEAAKWYLKAAKMGDVYAQFNLACLYEEGQGVVQSYADAAEWFTLAAKNGDMDAQYHLAMLYKDGKGVQQSYKDALYWLNLSAEQGMPESVYEIGVFYENGFEVERSKEEASRYYEVAEKLGYTKP